MPQSNKSITLPQSLFMDIEFVSVQPYSEIPDTRIPALIVDDAIKIARVADYLSVRDAGWRVPVGRLPAAKYSIALHYPDNATIIFSVTPYLLMTRYKTQPMWRRIAAGKYTQLLHLVEMMPRTATV
ncbi:MAG: hypothetical protein AAFR81_01770 [Chloroflexota bacterium]